VGYGYDAASNLTSLVYLGSHTVTRGYDALNRLHTVTDWLANTTTFGYDAASNLTSVLYPTSNNVGVVYSYDKANGIQSIVDETNATSTPTPFWTFGDVLDGNQQVRSLTDPTQSNGLHSYVRNALDQLTGDTQTGGPLPTSLSLGYDSAYRLTSRASSTANTASTTAYDYADELLNLQTKTGSTLTQNLAYTYNKDGDRLSQTDTQSGASASYSYDGDGLRQSKTISSPKFVSLVIRMRCCRCALSSTLWSTRAWG
jgi:YD repeat-containing protein